MNKQLLYIIALFLLSTLFVQCKAKKSLITETEEGINVSRNAADTIVISVLENNFVYENLKAKIKTKFKSREKQNLSFGTFVKMRKDSIIHATISLLGIPVVEALITPDSLQFINKKDQKYFSGEFSYVSQLLNTEISFSQIQELLVGNPIKMDSNTNHYLIQEDENIFISSLNKNELNDKTIKDEWKVKFWVNELLKAGKTILVNEEKETRIDIFQEDYKKKDDQLFPNRTKVEIVNVKDSISIQLNYQRVKINTDMDYEFSIPDHYTPYGKK